MPTPAAVCETGQAEAPAAGRSRARTSVKVTTPVSSPLSVTIARWLRVLAHGVQCLVHGSVRVEGQHRAHEVGGRDCGAGPQAVADVHHALDPVLVAYEQSEVAAPIRATALNRRRVGVRGDTARGGVRPHHVSHGERLEFQGAGQLAVVSLVERADGRGVLDEVPQRVGSLPGAHLVDRVDADLA